MNHTLSRQLGILPRSPGIYQFFTADDKLLYVGKAKNLQARVRSYFTKRAELSLAKQIMVSKIDYLSTTVVNNENEALLLEANLIKQHQPPYNIVLKDDKSWLYFAIDYREEYPRISLERRPTTKNIRYFGPYPSAGAARESLTWLKKILGLKTCVNPPDKPCFQSKLGRCLGHNLDPNSKNNYHQQLKKLEQILRGEVRPLIKSLANQMSTASSVRNFERAAKLRDQISALEKITAKQSVISPRRENFDVFGLARAGDNACVSKLPIRQGILLDAEKFLLEHTKQLTDSEVVSEFLEQYLPQVTNKPKTIFTGVNLSEKNIYGVKIITTERGYKKQLVKLANAAAATYLDQSVASWQRKEVRAQAGLVELQKLFNLKTLPQRIEGYDVSNIQGHEPVGAMVVLTNGIPDQSHYRKFKIQGIKGPNDFAMLAQMLVRRFTKNTDWSRPNLVMLDGGLPQLSTVKKALDQADIKIPLVALAKQEEVLYYYPTVMMERHPASRKKTNVIAREPLRGDRGNLKKIPLANQIKDLKLPTTSPALLLLEELRDEAHRFGITFYRSRHRKANIKSAWDELPGIGPKLKKKLKNAFSSINALRQATTHQIVKVVGIKKAETIKKIL